MKETQTEGMKRSKTNLKRKREKMEIVQKGKKENGDEVAYVCCAKLYCVVVLLPASLPFSLPTVLSPWFTPYLLLFSHRFHRLSFPPSSCLPASPRPPFFLSLLSPRITSSHPTPSHTPLSLLTLGLRSSLLHFLPSYTLLGSFHSPPSVFVVSPLSYSPLLSCSYLSLSHFSSLD